MNLLSIIIPVYNEEKTVKTLLKQMIDLKFRIPIEMVIINDGSTDTTKNKIEELLINCSNQDKQRINFITYHQNRGKGFAVLNGIKKSKGDIVLIQDADFEYDPVKIPDLITPILNKEEDIVFGSRYMNGSISKKQTKIAFWANQFLTGCLNLLYGSRLTDMHTCYKAFSRKVLDSILLTVNDFGIDVELTSKILRKGFRIKEIPIIYFARCKKKGKKITWKDGIMALFYLFRFRWQNLN